MEHRALVVADDLTGATDTGNEFAKRGVRTVVALEDGTPATAAVLVVDTDSRSAPPERASAAVSRAVRARSASLVYKKVDSTLRGNLVAEIDAALEASGAALAVVAPAFPANGRTTVDGRHLVDGRSVDQVFDGADGPETSDVSALLSESAYSVVGCGIERVERGPEAVREAFATGAADGPTIVVSDAASETHLESIARGAAETGVEVLYVGSAGLARHVRLPDGDDRGRRSTIEDDRPTEEHTAPGVGASTERRAVLAIAGSANPRTVEQVDAVPDERVVVLDAERAIDDPEAVANETAARALSTLATEGVVVVTSVPTRAAIERTRRAGAAAGLEEAELRGRIERALSRTAGTVRTERPLGGLVLTGGAVAVGVLGELDATGIELVGEEIDDGVPIGRVVGGRANGTRVITKAGGFGTERTITNCLARLRSNDD